MHLAIVSRHQIADLGAAKKLLQSTVESSTSGADGAGEPGQRRGSLTIGAVGSLQWIPP